MEIFTQFVQTFAAAGRYFEYAVADGAVKIAESVEVFAVVGFCEQVGLVDADYSFDVIGPGSREEAVDKGSGGGRVGERGHEHGAVDVCGDDMRLFRQVRSLPYDVVPAGMYAGDKSSSVRSGFGSIHDVAYGHRIGGANAFDSEISFYLAGNLDSPVKRFDNEVRTGIAYYSSCHAYKFDVKLLKIRDSAIKKRIIFFGV